MSQMSQIRSLYRALFRCSANIYVWKLRFAVVWLGQIQNVDTGHVYVLGVKSGSEWLWMSHVPHMNELCRTYVACHHYRDARVTQNEFCHTYTYIEWVLSCVRYIYIYRMRYVTQNEFCHAHVWYKRRGRGDMPHISADICITSQYIIYNISHAYTHIYVYIHIYKYILIHMCI